MLLFACQSSLGCFFLFALPGPIDQPALGDVGTGSGETSGRAQFSGELHNAALTGNLVAATPPAKPTRLQSISSRVQPLVLLQSPLVVCNKAHKCRSTFLSAAEQTECKFREFDRFLDSPK